MNHEAIERRFYTPEEVAILFRRNGDVRWTYRHASAGGFLSPYARRFGRKLLLFDRAGIDALLKEST